MKLTQEIVVDRACDEVYELVAGRLFDTYHLWNTGVIDIRQLTEGPVRVGSRGVAVNFVQRGKRGPREEGCAFEVQAMIDGRELVIEQSDPHFAVERSQFTLRFDPIGGRTRLALTEEIVWGNEFVGFARPFVWMRRKAEARRNLRRLRAALQAKLMPPPPMRPG